MTDKVIRAALKARLARRYALDTNALVLEELGIGHGATRIDLVVINHRLHGYEIKSDHDSLRRLPDQIRAYSGVMDRVTLVVGYRHAYDALRMVPDWWGVTLAGAGKRSNSVVLSTARAARDNPKVDPYAVASLLWRDEAMAILEDMGADDGMHSKRRAEVYRRLVDSSDPNTLRLRMRQKLLSREGWRVAEQPTPCGD